MKNLLKLYLWPLIKRFKALFITMAALTAIGITSLITFNGLSKGINENWNVYVTKSDAPHAFISTSVCNYGEKDDYKNYEIPLTSVEREELLKLVIKLYDEETKNYDEEIAEENDND